MNSVAASVLTGLLALSAYAQEPSAKGVNFYSLAREAQIGQESAAALEQTLTIVHAPKLDAYLANLSAELVKYADPRFAYSFTIYENRKPVALPWMVMATPADAFAVRAAEPVALPGGPILVPLSLLADAPDEAVFAFQLAHAVAHVALRHATKLATRQQIQGIGMVALDQVQLSRPAAAVIYSTQPLAMELGFLTFARAFEREADTLATGILADAGYDPAAVIPYLQAQPPAGEPRVFSAHPTAGRRTDTVKSKIEKLPSRVYGANTGGFDEVKALAISIR